MTPDSDNTPRDLRGLVLDRIRALGDDAAATYFEVSPSTIRVWRTGKNDPTLAAVQRCWDDSLLCQSPEAWGGTEQVKALIPAYEAVEPFFMISFIKAMKGYGMDKIGILPKTRTLIEEARNDLAEKFLLTTAKYALFLDVDMILPCGHAPLVRKMGVNTPDVKAGRNAITRIMSWPEEYRIVGGLYKDRRNGNKVQVAKAFSSAAENTRLLGLFTGDNTDDGIEEAGGWIAMGMVRIHRNVFEQMKAEAVKPDSPIADICPPPPPRDKEPFGFFGRSSRFRGEDVAFCRRAEMIGIRTWMDKGIICGHVGRRVF